MKPLKRWIAFLLAGILFLSNFPAFTISAQAEDGGCIHHTHSPELCSYRSALPERFCDHVHVSTECYQLTCTHIVHEGCTYREKYEGTACECVPDVNGIIAHPEGNTCGYEEGWDFVPCDHVCSVETGCISDIPVCEHSAALDCHTTPASDEVACDFVCEICADSEVENDEPAECICGDSSRCTLEQNNQECLVCRETDDWEEVCLGAAPVVPTESSPVECICENSDRCGTEQHNEECPVCSVSSDWSTVCLGSVPAVPPMTDPVEQNCVCTDKCVDIGNPECAVCAASEALDQDCVGEVTLTCDCRYHCTEDNQNLSCGICSKNYLDCTQTVNKPDCICTVQCTEEEKNPECLYCHEFDCEITNSWQQTVATAVVTVNWDDQSDSFGYRPAMDGIVKLFYGDSEVSGVSYAHHDGEDDTWTVTIGDIPVYVENTETPIEYIIKFTDGLSAYHLNANTAVLTFQEDGAYEPVSFLCKLPVTDLSGTVTWDSGAHPTADFYFQNYFEAKLGNENVNDRLTFEDNGNDWTFILNEVPVSMGDGSPALYTFCANAVKGFKEESRTEQVQAVSREQTVFSYTREVIWNEGGTSVDVTWLDGSGTNGNQHPGELKLSLKYSVTTTANGATVVSDYTINNFDWYDASNAYVHNWTAEEKQRLGLDENVEPLTIEDRGNNSLTRTLQTSELPVSENIQWHTPEVTGVDFGGADYKILADDVKVVEYDIEFNDGAYRLMPMVRVNFEINLRNGGKTDHVALLEAVKIAEVADNQIFQLKQSYAGSNRPKVVEYISAEKAFEKLLDETNEKIYQISRILPAYDPEKSFALEYTLDCQIMDAVYDGQIQDAALIADPAAKGIEGKYGYDLEYNNVEVYGEGGDITTAHNGGRIILTRAGTRTYCAKKIWLDDGNADQRPKNATYTLWRYAVGNYETAAQVEVNNKYTFDLDTLNDNEYEVPIEHSHLNRYDSDGYEYHYLIREKQTSSSYEKVFGVVNKETQAVTDTLPADYGKTTREASDTSVYHGGTISNRRVGTEKYQVTKSWEAAYYQDQLQNLEVELTIDQRHKDTHGDSTLGEWTEYKVVTMRGFNALNTSLTTEISLPKYGHMGHELEYRIRETNIREKTATGQLVDATILQQDTASVAADTESAVATEQFTFMLPMNQKTLDDESIEGAKDYFVSETTRDETHNTITIVNRLEGETAYFIRKTWESGMSVKNATFTLAQTGVTSGFRIYGTDTISKETDYSENSPYDSGWIRGTWKAGTTILPRYDETGNLYNYMVLEEDTTTYNSEYIYGEQVNGKFVYGHDVDGDNIREKNAVKIHNAPIGLERYINVRKVWLDDSANTDRGSVSLQIEATDIPTVLYGADVNGAEGLLGSYVVVNESNNWWDKVDVSVFEHGGKLYTASGFKKATGSDPTSENHYTGGFRVTEVSVGSSAVGKAANTAAGFKTVLNGKTRFVVMYDDVSGAQNAVEHSGNGKYYNSTGAVTPVQLTEHQVLSLLGEEAVEEAAQNQSYSFYTVTNLRIGTYHLTVNKIWKDDIARINQSGNASDEPQAQNTGEEIIRPEATFTLTCEENASSIVHVDGKNNDYITVSAVIDPAGKLPILKHEGNSTEAEVTADAVQTLNGAQDEEILYFCNLPRYDGLGRILHYQVTESLPEDTKYQSSNTGMSYDYANQSQGKLHASNTFTNKPQHNYSVQFHLLWLDQYRQEQNQRPDIYLHLYSKTGDNAPARHNFVEYYWTHDAQDDKSTDAWTYTFANLPEFDSNGNRITYYARIFTAANDKAQDYIDLQYGAGQCTNLQVWTGDKRLSEVNWTTGTDHEVTYQVTLKDNIGDAVILGQDNTRVMKENNTFVYQLKSDVKISGKKIWADVPTGFPAEDLPVLEFTLHNKENDEIRAIVPECPSTSHTYTFYIHYVGYNDSDGILIDTPEARAKWAALEGKTNLPYGTPLRRYDEVGNLDEYYLEEDLAASEIAKMNKTLSYEGELWGRILGDYELQNTYNTGGKNLREITLRKTWKKSSGPIPENFEFPEEVTFNLYRFYYDYHTNTYSTLQEPEGMPQGQVNAAGDPIATVTLNREQLEAAKGGIKLSFGNQWIDAPNGTPFIYFVEEVALNGYDPVILNLPQDVQQVTSKDNATWPSPIGKSWHSPAFSLKEGQTAVELTAVNNYTANYVTLSGKKTWVDHNNSQNTRPDRLTFYLYRSKNANGNGEELLATIVLEKDKVVSVTKNQAVANLSGDLSVSASNWSYAIENLDKYYSTTNPWHYKVVEELPAGYNYYQKDSSGTTGWKSSESESIHSMNLTNRLTTSVKVTKVWDNLNSGVEVPWIKVKLQVSEDNVNWIDAKTYFEEKSWWSANNKPAFEATLENGSAEYTFSNLPKGFGKGNYFTAYSYRVIETDISTDIGDAAVDESGNSQAYTVTYKHDFSGNIHSSTITNTSKEVVSFEVKKNWSNDAANAYFTRSVSDSTDQTKWNVRFALWRYQVDAYGNELADTQEEVENRNETAQIFLNVSDSKATDGMDYLAAKAPNGNAYRYYAVEVGVNDSGVYNGSYQAASNNAFETGEHTTTYTNELITTELSVTKYWDNATGNDEQTLNMVPDDLDVELLQNGVPITDRYFRAQSTSKLDWVKENGIWTFTFDGLPKYDKDGKAYTYSVVETRQEGYLKPAHGETNVADDGQTQNVTNTATRFSIDKTAFHTDTALYDVALTFTGGEYTLIWSRVKNGGNYVESYRINKGETLWSSGQKTNGAVEIIGLPVGTYKLTAENPIPLGYTNSALNSSFKLDQNGTVQVIRGDLESIAVTDESSAVLYYKLKVKNKPTTFTLYKQGKDNVPLTQGWEFTVEPLPGSKFADGTTTPKKLEPNSDGYASLPDGMLVAKNTYTLKEVKAPLYYKRAHGQLQFTVAENGDFEYINPIAVDATVSGSTVTFLNEPYSVKLLKYSTSGKKLSGAQFVLQEFVNNTWQDKKQGDITVTADSVDGVVTLDSIGNQILLSSRQAEHVYRLLEINAPAGYELVLDDNGNSLVVAEFYIIQEGNQGDLAVYQKLNGNWARTEDLALTLTNHPIEITLFKKDSGDGMTPEQPLGNVKFTLTRIINGKPDESAAQTAYTVANGENKGKLYFGPEKGNNTFAVVGGGQYRLSEQTPSGYETMQDISFSVTRDGKLVITGQSPVSSTDDTLTVVNRRIPGSVELTKQDTEGYAMNGVKFDLYLNEVLAAKDLKTGISYVASVVDGKLTIAEDPSEAAVIGKLTLTNLPWGSYQLVEQRPSGYEAEDNYVTAFELNGEDQKKLADNSIVVLEELTITNTPVKINVLKTGVSGTHPLKGARYEIYKRDSNADTKVQGNFSSYADGYTLYRNGKNVTVDFWNWDPDSGTGTAFRLQEGTYVLRETIPPAGYKVASDIILSINSEGKLTSISSEVDAGRILARDEKINFKLVKKDVVNGEPLEGVAFTLTAQGEADQTAVTDAKGEITFGHKDDGINDDGVDDDADFLVKVGVTYTLSETTAIYGYEKLCNSLSFTVNPDGTVKPEWTGSRWEDTDAKGNKTGAFIKLEDKALVLAATNARTPGKVILTKKDKESNTSINNITFTLYKKVEGDTWYQNFLNFLTGKSYEVARTFRWGDARTGNPAAIDEGMQIASPMNGVLEITGLEWGSYKLVETNADGYVLDETERIFTIGKDRDAGEVLEYATTVENIPNRFVLNKVDLADGSALFGEEFTLNRYDKQTGVRTALTAPASWEKKISEDGTEDTYVAMRLPKGDYILEETKAPDGYELAEPVIFTVNADGTITGLTGLTGNTSATVSQSVITVKDEKIHFELLKKDGGDQFAQSAVLEVPVAFTLTDSKGNTLTATTDNRGKLYFGADNGDHSFRVIGGQKYLLTEVVRDDNDLYSMTDGYYSIGSVELLVATDGTVSVTQNVDSRYKGTVHVADDGLLIEVVDERIPGIVMLKKLDEVSLAALDNVVFRLYRKVEGETWFDNFLNMITGKQYEVVKDFRWSDYRNPDDETVDHTMEIDKDQEQGVLTISGLPWGAYKLVEIKADGYIITPEEDNRSYSFTIDAQAGTSQNLQLDNITNEPNRLTVTKVAFENNTRILAGAVYELYNAAGNKIADDRWTWNSETGTGTATRLAPGEYILKEVRAPYGYTLAKDIRFQMDKYGTVTMDGVPVEDNRILAVDKQTKFTFTKKELIHETCSEYANQTRILPGVVFTAYEDAALTKVIATAVSDVNGTVTFTGLPLKDYLGAGTSTPVYIKEVQTASGHVLDSTVYQVFVDSVLNNNGEVISRSTLQKNGTDVAGNTVINDVYRNDFSFTKVSELDHSKKIAGATYGLYKTVLFTSGPFTTQKEILVAKSTSDANGIVTFRGLLMDVEYTVKELSVSAGSYLSKNSVSFKYTWNNGAVLSILDDGEDTIIMENNSILWLEPQVVVSIQKVNSAKKPLVGAELQIRDWKGTVIPVLDADGKLVDSWISTKNPLIVSGILEAGKTYRLYELDAPDGYVKARSVKFEIPDDPVEPDADKVIKVKMVNYAIDESPETGDDIITAVGSMFASAMALAVLMLIRRKKRTA